MCHSLLLSWKLQADPTRRDMNLPIGHGELTVLENHPRKVLFCTFYKVYFHSNIDLNSEDKCGLTRFMNACINGLTDVVKLKLK